MGRDPVFPEAGPDVPGAAREPEIGRAWEGAAPRPRPPRASPGLLGPQHPLGSVMVLHVNPLDGRAGGAALQCPPQGSRHVSDCQAQAAPSWSPPSGAASPTNPSIPVDGWTWRWSPKGRWSPHCPQEQRAKPTAPALGQQMPTHPATHSATTGSAALWPTRWGGGGREEGQDPVS